MYGLVFDTASCQLFPELALKHDPPVSASWIAGIIECTIILGPDLYVDKNWVIEVQITIVSRPICLFMSSSVCFTKLVSTIFNAYKITNVNVFNVLYIHM
jgi:hypothetical protein